MRSQELAARISERSVESITPENYRAILRRARLRFASLLIDEVQQSLEMPTRESLELELGELDLLEYCKPVLSEISE